MAVAYGAKGPDTIEPLDEHMVTIALFRRGRVDFDQVIRRYSKKILRLRTGNKDNR